MDKANLRITRSIGLSLFKRIFGVYCIIAILITAFQVWGEYRMAKDYVQTHIREYQPFLEESLANAVWHLDMPQLDRILAAILENRDIVGASIRGEGGKILNRVGAVSTDEESLSTVDLGVPSREAPLVQFSKNLFSHHFSLADPNGLSESSIGEVVFYSDPSVVMSEIKGTVTSIFVGALFKTAILCLLFAYFGRRLLSRPLSRMMTTVKSLSLGPQDLEVPRGKEGVNELKLLEGAIETMRCRLRKTLDDLQVANQQLSQTNLVLQRAMEQSPTVISVYNREGYLEYTNPGFTKIYGYPASEAQKATEELLYRDRPIREVIKNLLDPTCPETSWRQEIKNQAKDGRTCWVSATLTPILDAEDNVTHFVGIDADINALKQTEQALKCKTEEQQETIQKLETAQNQLLQSEKMASIGQLAAGVAHEINNPIGYVNSNLGTLNKYLEDLTHLIDLYDTHLVEYEIPREKIDNHKREIDFEYLKEDVSELVSESRAGIGRVKQIIKDLKDFSHVGKEEWEFTDIHGGLDSTINIAWNEIKYKAEVVKAYGQIPAIECMPYQLNQVFMNLLINAAQAIEGEGTITIVTDSDDSWAWVEIRDTGKGISQADRKRLFEPFFTTKPIGKGTGLGLSVSYGIVKNHGGRIEVDSEVDVGSTFRVILPLTQPLDSAGNHQSEAQPGRSVGRERSQTAGPRSPYARETT